MAPRKNLLSIKGQMEVIYQLLEKEKISLRAITKRLNINKIQVSEIFRYKQTICSKWMPGGNIRQKKGLIRPGIFKTNICSKWVSGVNFKQKKSFLNPRSSDICKKYFNWYTKADILNMCTSGSSTKAKISEIIKIFGMTNLYESKAWLYQWIKIPNIVFKCINKTSEDLCQASQEAEILRNKEIIRTNGWKWKGKGNGNIKKYFFKRGRSTIQNQCFKRHAKFYKQNITNCRPNVHAKANRKSSIIGSHRKYTCGKEFKTKMRTMYYQYFVQSSDVDQSESKDEVEPINSYDEALKQIVRLKRFAKGDLIAYHPIKNLEAHFKTQQFKLNQTVEAIEYIHKPNS